MSPLKTTRAAIDLPLPLSVGHSGMWGRNDPCRPCPRSTARTSGLLRALRGDQPAILGTPGLWAAACGVGRGLTQKVRVPTRPGLATKVNGNRASQFGESPYNEHSGMIVGNRDPQRHITATETIGWEPTCKCGEEVTVPCTVLDPFLGSGTSAVMAEYLGRKWIGIELNEEYAAIARARIAAGYAPPKVKTSRKRRKKLTQQRQLFSE